MISRPGIVRQLSGAEIVVDDMAGIGVIDCLDTILFIV